MARIVSFVVLVAILIGIGILFLEVMWSFLLPLFLAALFGVVFQPLYNWLLGKVRDYRYIASALTTLLVLLLVLVPAGFVLTLAALEGFSLLDRIEISAVPEHIDKFRKTYDLEIPQAKDLFRLESSIDRWREQQQAGDVPQYTLTRIDNLLARVESLEEHLREVAAGDTTRAQLDGRPELSKLREALEQLRTAEKETIEADEALAHTEATYRVFKREFLGGTYQAWLKELANPTDSQLQSLRSSLLGLTSPNEDSQKSERTISRSSPLVVLGGNTIAGVLKLLVGVVIMVIALFFFLAEGSRMINAIVRLSPLEEKYLREMIAEFERISRAVVAATLLAAVAQGILAGIGFYFAGLQQSVALLMILTMFLSMVPFMGAAAVWIPVCLYLAIEGHYWSAGGLAIYGLAVISAADNFIKPIVLHGQSNLHPLLALLSVLGGIAALGPIGIMVGPMAVVFLQTLLKILQREMLSLDRENRPPLSSWMSSWSKQIPASERKDVTATENAAAVDANLPNKKAMPPATPTVPKEAPPRSSPVVGKKPKRKR